MPGAVAVADVADAVVVFAWTVDPWPLVDLHLLNVFDRRSLMAMPFPK